MDSAKEVVMTSWSNKGCSVCRRQWETGEQPTRLGISFARHAYLHQCDVCGSYWEQYERYADVISIEDARNFYPDLVKGVIEK